MATADAAETPADAPPARSRKPLIFGLAGALVLGGAGFYVTWSGLIGGGGKDAEGPGAHAEAPVRPDIAFVPVPALTVSLPPGARSRHLRFAAELEVATPHAAEVTLLLPRVIDVLNGYLRAVDAADLEDPAALVRVRAQMLRRVQLVTGEGRVRDLLVTEFLLN